MTMRSVHNAPFICRSCLSQFRQRWRHSQKAVGARMLTNDGTEKTLQSSGSGPDPLSVLETRRVSQSQKRNQIHKRDPTQAPSWHSYSKKDREIPPEIVMAKSSVEKIEPGSIRLGAISQKTGPKEYSRDEKLQKTHTLWDDVPLAFQKLERKDKPEDGSKTSQKIHSPTVQKIPSIVQAHESKIVTFRKYEPKKTFWKYVPQGPDKRYLAVTQSPVPSVPGETSEKGFDALNYSTDDLGFWATFDEVWEPPPTANGSPNVLVPDPSFKSRPLYAEHWTARLRKSREREAEGPEKGRKDDSLLQMRYLIGTTAPEKREAALARFWDWKKRIKRYEKLIEGGQLPAKTSEIQNLRRLLHHGDTDTMKSAWEELTTDRRQLIFPDIILSALQSSPDRILDIFKATFDPSLVPVYIIQDVVRSLARQQKEQSPAAAFSASPRDLCELVKLTLEAMPRSLRFRQNTIYHLVSVLDVDEVAALHQLLVGNWHPLHKFTQLQFASRLSKELKHKQLSVSILESIVQSTDFDINSPQGSSLCTSILSMSEESLKEDPLPATPGDLFERLLDCGLKPNLITYTTIIRDLCLNRKLDAAWKVFYVATGHYAPDERLCSTLLNGSKLRHDVESMRRTVGIVVDTGFHDRFIWNDLLHGIYVMGAIDAKKAGLNRPRVNPSFTLMIQAYSKLFTMEKLKPLLLGDADELANAGQWWGLQRWFRLWQLVPVVQHTLPLLRPDSLLEPNGITLSAMLTGYVSAMSRPHDIIAFYSHFRELLETRNPSAVCLVEEQGTVVHDIVIKRLGEFGMLRLAFDVLSDMLETASSRERDSSTAIHPQPSCYTWSILLNALMHHRQMDQARHVLEQMRRHGIKPDLPTWNALAMGYARLQDPYRTVEMLRGIENAGFKPDKFTFKAFRRLKNQKIAFNYMEALLAYNSTMAQGLQEDSGMGLPKGQLRPDENIDADASWDKWLAVEDGEEGVEKSTEGAEEMVGEDGEDFGEFVDGDKSEDDRKSSRD